MRRCTLLFLIVAVILGSGFSAPAWPLDLSQATRPTYEELIQEGERLTGLSSNVLSLVFKEDPKLLGAFGDNLFVLKVVNLFYQAKDHKAAVEIAKFVAMKQLQKLLKNFPKTSAYLSALSAYITSLELVRDYVMVPSIEEEMYRAYKEARTEGDASPSEAFDQAYWTVKGSNYFAMREKLYREFIKAKGYDPDIIGEKLKKELRSQLDRFWCSKLEARYRREQFLREYPKIIERNKKELEAIKKKIQLMATPWEVEATVLDRLSKRPIRNALFILEGHEGHFERVTDRTGKVRLESVPVGTYSLTVQAYGYKTLHKKRVLLRPSLRPQPPRRIRSGKVFLAPGIWYMKVAVIDREEKTPISGARISLRGNGLSKEVLTNRNGKVTIKDIPPGSYSCTVQAAGYSPIRRDIKFDPLSEPEKIMIKRVTARLSPEINEPEIDEDMEASERLYLDFCKKTVPIWAKMGFETTVEGCVQMKKDEEKMWYDLCLKEGKEQSECEKVIQNLRQKVKKFFTRSGCKEFAAGYCSAFQGMGRQNCLRMFSEICSQFPKETPKEAKSSSESSPPSCEEICRKASSGAAMTYSELELILRCGCKTPTTNELPRLRR